ncbi:uncharacterized protein [Antennarius striatus]|uniref:uncharacterized protein n=1 Tax=Antennarius striatus TaxID=241820 RepID=UPI0035B3EE23
MAISNKGMSFLALLTTLTILESETITEFQTPALPVYPEEEHFVSHISQEKIVRNGQQNYIIEIAANVSDVESLEAIRSFLDSGPFPVQLDDNTDISDISITTVCSSNAFESQCRCEEQFAWPLRSCVTYGACDYITSGICQCIDAIPADGLFCLPISELLTEVEYSVDVELNVTNVQTVDFLLNLLKQETLNLTLGPRLNVTDIDVTTVCSTNGSSYQCVCENQYAWSYNTCITYEACDEITDGTCGCISAIPANGQYCQLRTDIVVLDYQIVIEVRTTDIALLRDGLLKVNFPIVADSQINITAVVITTVCRNYDAEFQCRCEDGFLWPCDKCVTYRNCDVNATNTCGCISAIPADGQYCQSIQEHDFSICPTTAPVVFEYIISIELKVSDLSLINQLRAFLRSSIFPISINEQVKILDANITTVCIPNSNGFQCICEEEYRWSCEQCLVFGHCDIITNDTCGCIDIFLPGEQYCQSIHEYNFIPCLPVVQPSSRTELTTVSTSFTTTSATITFTSTTESTPVSTSFTTATTSTTPVTNATTPITTQLNTTSTDLKIVSTSFTTTTTSTPITFMTTVDSPTTATTQLSTTPTESTPVSTSFTTATIPTTPVTNSTTDITTQTSTTPTESTPVSTSFTTATIPTTPVTNSTTPITTQLNTTSTELTTVSTNFTITAVLIVDSPTTATTQLSTTPTESTPVSTSFTTATIPTTPVTNSTTDIATQTSTTPTESTPVSTSFTTATIPTTPVTNSTVNTTTEPNTTPTVLPTTIVTNSTLVSTTSMNTTIPTTLVTNSTANITTQPNATPTVSPTTIVTNSTAVDATFMSMTTPTTLATNSTTNMTTQPNSTPTVSPTTIVTNSTPVATTILNMTTASTMTVNVTNSTLTATTFMNMTTSTALVTNSTTITTSQLNTTRTVSPTAIVPNSTLVSTTSMNTTIPTTLVTNSTANITTQPNSTPTVSPTTIVTNSTAVDATFMSMTTPTTPLTNSTTNITTQPNSTPTVSPTTIVTNSTAVDATFMSMTTPTTLATNSTTNITTQPNSTPTVSPTTIVTNSTTVDATFMSMTTPTTLVTNSTANITTQPNSTPTVSPTTIVTNSTAVDATFMSMTTPTTLVTNSTTSTATQPNTTPTALPTATVTNSTTITTSQLNTTRTVSPTAIVPNSTLVSTTSMNTTIPTTLVTNSTANITTQPNSTPTVSPTTIVTNSTAVDATFMSMTTPTTPVTNSTTNITTQPNSTPTVSPTTIVTNSTAVDATFMSMTTPTTLATNSTTNITTQPNSTPTVSPTTIVTNSTTVDATFMSMTTPTTLVTNSTANITTQPNSTPTVSPTTIVTNSTAVDATFMSMTTPTTLVTNSTTSTATQPNTTPTALPTATVTNSTTITTTQLNTTPTVLPTTIIPNSTVVTTTSINTKLPTTLVTSSTTTTTQPNSTPTVSLTTIVTNSTAVDATFMSMTTPTTLVTNSTTSTATQPNTTPTVSPTTTVTTTTSIAPFISTITTSTPIDVTNPPTTPSTPSPDLLNLDLTVRLDREFTPALDDPTSEEFQTLASSITAALDSAYRSITGFEGVTVIDFEPGSIITDYTVQTTRVIAAEITEANQRVPEELSPIAPVLGSVTAFFNSSTPISFPSLTYTGNNMTLTCGPPDNVNVGDISASEWRFRGREITGSGRIIVGVSDRQSFLTINNVILADIGLYECTQRGSAITFLQRGVVTANEIRQAPILRLQSRINVECIEGAIQPLQCCVQPQFRVQWFQGTNVLSFTEEVDSESYCITHNFQLEGCSELPGSELLFMCVVVEPQGFQGTTRMTVFIDDVVCDDDIYGTGRVQDISIIACNEGQEGFNSAVCRETGEWELFEDTCIVIEIKELLIVSQDLVVEEVPELVSNLSRTSRNEQTQITNSTATITAIVDIINNVATVSTVVSETVIQDVLESVDVIIASETTESWVILNANETGNASSRLLGSLEVLSQRLVGEFSVETERIVLNRTVFNNSFLAELNNSVTIDIPDTNFTNVFITTITLSTLNNVMPTRNSSFDVNLFNGTNNETETDNAINGAVLLVQINATIENVTLSFDKINNSLLLNPQCVFWNFTLFNDLGAWDDEGCTFVSDINDTVTCNCNHLTSFSILMATGIPPVLRVVLDIITYIGVGISLASLVICLVIEGYVWKAITKNSTAFMRHLSIINTALSLLIADICFIIAASIADNPLENPGEDHTVPVGPCSAVTFFMHYFYLALFFWMLVSGLLLFYRTVMVFSHMSKSVMMAIGFTLGYGCPLIIAVVTVAATAPGNGYIRRTDACWLNWFETKALLALVIPALAIVAINIIILLVVLFKMLRRGIGDAAQTEEKHTLVVIARCVIILTPLFGLTWGLGIGTIISSTNQGIHIAFAFFNSLQGFFILVFGTLFDSKVISLLTRKLPTPSSVSNPTGSSSAGISSLSGLSWISRLRGRRNIYRVSEANTSSSNGVTESFVNTAQ